MSGDGAGDGLGDGALRALADPTRAAMLRLLLAAPDGRATVTELARELDLRQPTVSHHMKLLREVGLVHGAVEGRRTWYALAPEQRDRVSELLDVRTESRMTGHVLQRIIGDLAQRFDGTFSRGTIERYVLESYDLLAERARITRYLPSLTARFAAERLAALAAAERRDDPGRPLEVLFVCVQNAGRSQLAAAILRQLAGDRVVVRTAGSAPAEAVRASVVAALDEIGVSVGGEFPKPLTDEAVRAADVVVTMGCGDACPVYPGRRYLDWAVDDPVGRPIEEVRRIRDDIDGRVRELLTTLA
jgi:arsenate reductase (thioredoxin)